MEAGAAHPNICRLRMNDKKKVQRTVTINITVRCTFEKTNNTFSINIIATLSLSTQHIM